MKMKNDFPIIKQSKTCNQSKNSYRIKRHLIEQALRYEIRDYTLVDKNQKQKLER
jgi:hypothetical protein